VLKSTGPIGNPGMPESGVIPIPRKLAGVKDMLRLSDGRMSGTAGGTIVLHISPESGMVDSPFGILRDGDVIECSVAARRLHIQLTEAEIQERIVERQAVLAKEKQVVEGRRILGVKRRGYRGLYEGTVNQAEHGADFEFLTANGTLN
jgi:dihydroxy-acid dehydratase